MKTVRAYPFSFSCLVLIGLLFSFHKTYAQGCVNADFSDGNFNGWTGTYSINQCSETGNNGSCKCSPTNPYNTVGFNQGPNNDPVNDATNEYCQIITTAGGGNDVNLTGYGYSLPTVWAGSPYSARIGNMWQDVGDTKTGDGESISYSFAVTDANCNFTYHYAVVLFNGNHSEGQQAYFNIHMTAGSGDTVACATYEVDATTAATIGGFSQSADSVYWKPWSSVDVPLTNYIGQTVTITFTTRGCIPKGCAGKHYAYAYISAECAPLNLKASSSVDCGLNDTLTAPAGAATYNWTGPGIVGSSTNQVVIINQPGRYVVTMTTFGNTSCSFTMDTLITGINLRPNFIWPITCAGSPTTFTDLSTPSGITAWQWSFGDGGTANTQNPTHTFANTGTYPVTLTVTDSPCVRDITLNVPVVALPTSSFTAVSPECEGSNSNIVYTGNAPASYTYTWDFDGGTGIPVTGQGPLNISWQLPGIKTITLTVSAGSCTSLTDTEEVLVKPYPGMTLTHYTAICDGDSIALNAANATIYTWAPDPTLSNTDSSTVIADPITTTTYYVTGTNTNCISVDTVTIAVIPVPTSTFTATGPVCIGQNSTVTYTGNGDASLVYTWNFGGGTATPDTGIGPLLVNWLTPGPAYITLAVSRAGCANPVTDTISVFSSPPVPAITADTVIGCPGVDVCFTSSPVGNNIGYIWNFGDGDTSGQQNTCHIYTAPGTYMVHFQVALSPECVFDSTLAIPITVIPDPVAAFTSSIAEIQQPQSLISFTNLSQNALTYLWNFGFAGGTADTLGGSTDINTQFNFLQYGVYNVTLFAYNQLHCPDSITHQVTVLPAQNFFIPNVFTPNGDGVNDDFFVYLQEGATLLSMQIFDRWGEKVHDGLYPWDGTYKGQKAPEGVYVYQVNIHLISEDQDIERKGSVTLLR